MPAHESSLVLPRGHLNTEGYPRVSYETWHSSNIGPWITQPEDIAGCKFLPLVTQKDFAISTSTDPNHPTEPLRSVSANCNRYPTSGIGLGQKRKHGAISLREDGCLTARKRLQKQTLPCDSAFLDHHEFTAANMGAWQPPHQYEDAYMSKYTLAMPGQYSDVTRRGVTKNIPIWVGEDDRWRETQFGNENLVLVVTAGSRQLESAEGLS